MGESVGPFIYGCLFGTMTTAFVLVGIAKELMKERLSRVDTRLSHMELKLSAVYALLSRFGESHRAQEDAEHKEHMAENLLTR